MPLASSMVFLNAAAFAGSAAAGVKLLDSE